MDINAIYSDYCNLFWRYFADGDFSNRKTVTFQQWQQRTPPSVSADSAASTNSSTTITPILSPGVMTTSALVRFSGSSLKVSPNAKFLTN